MEAGLKFVYAFLLIGSIQGIHAGVIGDLLIQRQTTDTAAGFLYAYDGNFGTVGDVLTWSFYAGTGRTPHHTDNPGLIDFRWMDRHRNRHHPDGR